MSDEKPPPHSDEDESRQLTDEELNTLQKWDEEDELDELFRRS